MRLSNEVDIQSPTPLTGDSGHVSNWHRLSEQYYTISRIDNANMRRGPAFVQESL